jgi:phospholipase B1
MTHSYCPSITAGFAAKGIQGGTIFNLSNLNENRGVSWSMGGDPDTVTFPSFIKYYQPKLRGASVGDHGAEVSNCNHRRATSHLVLLGSSKLCAGSLCPQFQCELPIIFYSLIVYSLTPGFPLDKPTQDILNAAQSAARASNLQHELDYLIPGELDYTCWSWYDTLAISNTLIAITNLLGGNLQTDWKIVTLQIGSKYIATPT